jgi:RNA polymerase sigma-70 factor (ECF subfamily)
VVAPNLANALQARGIGRHAVAPAGINSWSPTVQNHSEPIVHEAAQPEAAEAPAKPRTRDDVVKAAFQYRDALLSYSYAMLRNWTLAEDVVQEAYLVVMNKWQDLKDDAGIFLWVRQIVHFKTLEAIRSRGRETSTPDQELLDLVEQAVKENLDDHNAERQRLMGVSLRECMARLNEFNVDLLAGFYWKQESCETLADRHGRSVNAIRLMLSRLRDKLRNCLSKRLESQGIRP